MAEYDICVSIEKLLKIEEKLRKIQNGIKINSERMKLEIDNSHGFLAGKQYEDMVTTTKKCCDTTAITVDKIEKLLSFISQLQEAYNDYSAQKYSKDLT